MQRTERSRRSSSLLRWPDGPAAVSFYFSDFVPSFGPFAPRMLRRGRTRVFPRQREYSEPEILVKQNPRSNSRTATSRAGFRTRCAPRFRLDAKRHADMTHLAHLTLVSPLRILDDLHLSLHGMEQGQSCPAPPPRICVADLRDSPCAPGHGRHAASPDAMRQDGLCATEYRTHQPVEITDTSASSRVQELITR